MRAVVADIDGTLIHWSNQLPVGHRIVDRWRDRVATIGHRQLILLQALTKGRQLILASLRSPSQYMRLGWNLHAQDFVILDGGATILQSSERDRDWDDFVRQTSTLHSRDGRRALATIAHLISPANTRSIRISSTYARVRLDTPITTDDAGRIEGAAAAEGYGAAASTNDVLIEVPEVSKAAALRHVVERHGVTVRATAGDGALDWGFVAMAPIRFAPQGSAIASVHAGGIEVVPRSAIPWRLSLAT